MSSRRTHCTYHCTACGSHFHSLDGFDLHRRVSAAGGRECTDPYDDKRLVPLTTKGVCELVPGADLGAVVIWTHGAGLLRGMRQELRATRRGKAATASQAGGA